MGSRKKQKLSQKNESNYILHFDFFTFLSLKAQWSTIEHSDKLYEKIPVDDSIILNDNIVKVKKVQLYNIHENDTLLVSEEYSISNLLFKRMRYRRDTLFLFSFSNIEKKDTFYSNIINKIHITSLFITNDSMTDLINISLCCQKCKRDHSKLPLSRLNDLFNKSIWESRMYIDFSRENRKRLENKE